MKKLMAVLLSMVLVFGFSTMVMADGNGPANYGQAQLEVGFEIHPYAEFGIVTDFFTSGGDILSGLFNDMNIMQPGLYVSDGGATRKAAGLHFFGDKNVAAANQVNDNNVEMIVVAANIDTELTMSSDFVFVDDNDEDDTWGNAEVMFRFSSRENIGDQHDPVFLPASAEVGNFDPFEDPNDPDATLEIYNDLRWANLGYNNTLIARGSVTNNTMALLSTATGITGAGWEYYPIGGGNWPFIASDDNDTASIIIPYRTCKPALIHINGALLLEKATSMPAGKYSTTIDFTLAAAPAE